MVESWGCNPANTPTNSKMWGLDQPLDWWIWSAKLVQNGANAIQALTTNETLAMAKHFYLDENDGHWHFFYQIMGAYFDEKEGEFQIRVHY